MVMTGISPASANHLELLHVHPLSILVSRQGYLYPFWIGLLNNFFFIVISITQEFSFVWYLCSLCVCMCVFSGNIMKQKKYLSHTMLSLILCPQNGRIMVQFLKYIDLQRKDLNGIWTTVGTCSYCCRHIFYPPQLPTVWEKMFFTSFVATSVIWFYFIHHSSVSET